MHRPLIVDRFRIVSLTGYMISSKTLDHLVIDLNYVDRPFDLPSLALVNYFSASARYPVAVAKSGFFTGREVQ